VAIALWVASFFFYCLTGTGHSSFGDGYLLFRTARSLLDHASFAIEPVPGAGKGAQRIGRDGRTFAIFGPAHVFAEIPAIALGRRLPEAFQPTSLGEPVDDLQRDEFWAVLTNSWIAATIVSVVYLSGLALRFSPAASLTNAALLAVASPLWCFARTDGTEALQALFLVAAAYALIGVDERTAPRLIAGICLAGAVFAKLANAALAPLYLVFWARRSARMLALLLPVGAGLLLYGVYDAVRFGSPWDTGYHLRANLLGESRVRGAWSLVVSPSCGLVFFWPLSLLMPFGVRAVWNRDPRLAFLAGATPIALLLLYSGSWAFWQFAWGPRYLIPAVPLLSLFLLPVVSSRRRVHRAAVVAGGVLGVGVGMIAASVSWWHQVLAVYMSVQRASPLDAFRDARLAPLRIGGWWLRIIFSEHLAGHADAALLVMTPPWRTAFPWNDSETTLTRLWNLRGLDLWAVPTSWRMPYRPVGRGVEGLAPIASNTLLAVALFVLFALALCALVREIRRAAACESPDDVP